jgi:hypothetical protein
MNTLFNYLYRDASNYKEWGEIVFKGEATQALGERFARALDGGDFFIADQIRIPEVFPSTWPVYADDHCWHESAGFELTERPVTDSLARAIEAFVVEAERASSAGWRDFDPQQRVRRR